jgi:hypothetical protein
MGGHRSFSSFFLGGGFDAQIGPRPDPAKTLGTCPPGRKRRLAGRRIRPPASNRSPSPEAVPRPRAIGPDSQLWPAQAPAPGASRRDPSGCPRLATTTSHLGGGVDPRDARRESTSDRLAQPRDDPTLVPGRRVGPGSGRAAAGSLHHPGRPTPSDLANRCLRTHPARRQDRSLLASDPRRGNRGRLEDDRFPPSASSRRSTLVPPRPHCGSRSRRGGGPNG